MFTEQRSVFDWECPNCPYMREISQQKPERGGTQIEQTSILDTDETQPAGVKRRNWYSIF